MKNLNVPNSGNVPKLRFPEFTEEWNKYKLEELTSIVGRIGFRGYTTNDIVEKGNGAIALSPTNIVNNKLTYDKDNTYISFYKYEESPEIKIQQGDVIFVKTGSTVGKVAYVETLICETTLNPQVVVLKNIKCHNFLLSVILSTFCTLFDWVRRKIMVDRPTRKILQATEILLPSAIMLSHVAITLKASPCLKQYNNWEIMYFQVAKGWRLSLYQTA